MSDEVYRLALAAEVPEDAWKRRLEWTTAYKGVAGLDDGFIHLSTAEQVVSTAELYFADRCAHCDGRGVCLKPGA